MFFSAVHVKLQLVWPKSCKCNLLYHSSWKREFPHVLMLAVALIRFPSTSGKRRFAVLTFKASQFQHILSKRSVMQEVYAGNPLAALSYSRRGFLLQKWAKHFLAHQYPNVSALEPDLGKCIDGRSRTPHTAEYDLLFGGRRVELKSAQLCFHQSRTSWEITWRGIKFLHPGGGKGSAFDDLYLTMLTPDGLQLFKHDLRTGMSTDGYRTVSTGHVIRLYGPRMGSWQAASDRIARSLCCKGSCEDVGYSRINDSMVQEIISKDHDCGAAFYQETPMAFINGAARGNLIQHLVFEVDRHLHATSIFSLPLGEETYLGPRRVRNSSNATTDWIRDGIRIETKHAKLCFNAGAQRWQCMFQAIKKDLFDELLLAIYSPMGVFIFLYSTSLRLTSSGTHGEYLGHSLCLRGPAHELDPSLALEAIFTKLSRYKCQHVATIFWE